MGPREALFVKLFWDLVCKFYETTVSDDLAQKHIAVTCIRRGSFQFLFQIVHILWQNSAVVPLFQCCSHFSWLNAGTTGQHVSCIIHAKRPIFRVQLTNLHANFASCVTAELGALCTHNFQYDGWNSYTLQCGTITTLIASGDCILQCGIWLWNREREFIKWHHPAMWYVALGWHAIEFAQTSAVLEFYIWFPFPNITATDMSFCTVLQNFIQIGPPSAEKKDVMSIFMMADLSRLGL